MCSARFSPSELGRQSKAGPPFRLLLGSLFYFSALYGGAAAGGGEAAAAAATTTGGAAEAGSQEERRRDPACHIGMRATQRPGPDESASGPCNHGIPEI